MTVRDRIYHLLFCFLMGAVYSYALSRSAMAATVLEVPQAHLLLYCVIWVGLFCLLFFNKHIFLTALGALALLAVFVCFYLRAHQFQVEWYLQLRALADEILLFSQDLIPQQEAYLTPIMLGTAAAVSLLAVLNLQVHFNFYLLTLIAAVVFAVPLYRDWDTSSLSYVLFVFCFVVFLAKRLNLFARAPVTGSSNPVFALAAVPVCLLLLGLSWILPKPDIEVQDKQAQQYFLEAADNLIYDMGGGARSLSFSRDEGDLGGPVLMDDQFVMEVFAEDRLYLAGTVRDTYTGVSWTLSQPDKVEVGLVEDSEWYSVSSYEPEMIAYQQYFMRYYDRSMKSVTVNILEKRTRTLFSPPFSSFLWVSGEQEVTRDGEGSLTADRPLNRYTTYVHEYLSWNYNSPYFPVMLRSRTPNAEANHGPEMERYLRLPEELPERVGELAAEITAGQGTDYDKIKALERHLVQYRYTLAPSILPAGEDLVDYFLFEGQEGYCVYYASALAVMARTLGIPSRYVEGFVLPQESGENGGYTVTNQQAHAWAELYFPDLGWVMFEATAPNYYALYDEIITEVPDWEPNPESDVLINPGTRPTPEPEQEQAPEPETELEPPENISQEEEPENAAVQAGVPLGVLALFLFLAAAAGLLLFAKLLAAARRRKLEQIAAMPNREAAVAYFGWIVKAVWAFGCPMRVNETAYQYAARLAGNEAAPVPVDWIGQAADIFSRARYSREAVTDEEKDFMKKCYFLLLARHRKAKTRVEYFISRYLLMQM